MPPQPYPWVTDVAYKDNQIVLTVKIEGFSPGETIELSGYATQEGGAFAVFNDLQTVPEPNPGNKILMYVKSLSSRGFVEGDAVTVVFRAARVWTTVLDEGEEGESNGYETAGQQQPELADGTSWSIRRAASYPAAPSTGTTVTQPQEGKLTFATTSRSGRPGMRSAGTGLYHGTWWDLYKDDQLEQMMAGRFIRLLPEDRDPVDWDDLKKLAKKMTSEQEPTPTPETQPDPEEDREITAAYTYLGQFVDHDLTFDPTSRLREALNDRQLEALADFRTPRFDLDNLYGRGPDDQPYMYADDGIRMLLGEPMSGNPFDPDARQIPRGPSGRALIGDPRNDENRIVAQLHAIFLRFHNRVADYLARPEHLGKNVSFEAVRQQVRWHYQWMLVTDFLPTVVNSKTFRSVFADLHNPAPRLPGFQDGLRLMPVEFSVAAFRFGHSMIRPQYRLNTTVERRPIFLPKDHDSARVDDAADLGGFRPIPSDWAIDWQFFIDLEHGATPAATAPLFDPIARKPQRAYKIDTSLASPLGHLPARIASHPSRLARRNLERGATFKLPSGQAVARALGEKVIRDKDLVIGKATEKGEKTLVREIGESFAGRAPLWAYILSEAQVSSWDRVGSSLPPDDIPIKLGPVGGRIVAGVFAALLRGDPTSYLHEGARFTPIPDFTHGGRFGLAELINVALGRVP